MPNCDKRACQDDGCGGKCECPKDTGVNAQGESVPLSECKDTCKSAGWTCGTLCGVDCGSCGEDAACKGGQCVCAPKCDGTRCDDGCGGSCDCAEGTVCNAHGACLAPDMCTDTCESTGKTCGSICGHDCGACGDDQSCIDGQCRLAVSCRDCGLQLKLLEREVVRGKIVRVKLAVEARFSGEDSGPRLIDLRVASDKELALVEAVAGPALLEKGKDLFVDEATQRTWQRRGDGSFQLLAYSVSGTLRVGAGRIMTLTFDLAEEGPLHLNLVRHAQTLAPLDVDNILQASTYDDALVLTQ